MAVKRRRNPAVPVLLMNPDEEDQMARRKTTRRKTTRRRSSTRRRTTARANPRRRRRRAAPRRTTRRRRRRRNPKMDLMGMLIAGLGGAAVGGGAYALEGQVEPQYQALILGAGGVLLGSLASMYNAKAGAGIAGAGVGIAAKQLLDLYIAQNGNGTQGMGRIPGYAYKKFGHTPSRPHYWHMPYRAQLDAVQADLGAVQADLGNVYADIS